MGGLTVCCVHILAIFIRSSCVVSRLLRVRRLALSSCSLIFLFCGQLLMWSPPRLIVLLCNLLHGIPRRQPPSRTVSLAHGLPHARSPSCAASFVRGLPCALLPSCAASLTCRCPRAPPSSRAVSLAPRLPCAPPPSRAASRVVIFSCGLFHTRLSPCAFPSCRSLSCRLARSLFPLLCSLLARCPACAVSVRLLSVRYYLCLSGSGFAGASAVFPYLLAYVLACTFWLFEPTGLARHSPSCVLLPDPFALPATCKVLHPGPCVLPERGCVSSQQRCVHIVCDHISVYIYGQMNTVVRFFNRACEFVIDNRCDKRAGVAEICHLYCTILYYGVVGLCYGELCNRGVAMAQWLQYSTHSTILCGEGFLMQFQGQELLCAVTSILCMFLSCMFRAFLRKPACTGICRCRSGLHHGGRYTTHGCTHSRSAA